MSICSPRSSRRIRSRNNSDSPDIRARATGGHPRAGGINFTSFGIRVLRTYLIHPDKRVLLLHIERSVSTLSPVRLKPHHAAPPPRHIRTIGDRACGPSLWSNKLRTSHVEVQLGTFLAAFFRGCCMSVSFQSTGGSSTTLNTDASLKSRALYTEPVLHDGDQRRTLASSAAIRSHAWMLRQPDPPGFNG